MRALFLTFLFALLLSFNGGDARAQASNPSCPTVAYGQVWTPAQWNTCLTSLQPYLGYTPVNRAGDTMQGKLNALASQALAAGFSLGQGVAPSSPANGDIWLTASGLYAQIAGATVGPFGSVSGNVTGPASSTTNDLASYADTTGKIIADSGIARTNINQTTGSVTSGHLTQYNGLGKLTSDSGIVAANVGLVPTSTGSSTGNTLTGPVEFFQCTAGCTVTPPAPVAGYQFCVWDKPGTSGVIILGALSGITYSSQTRSGYGTANTGTLTSGGASGDEICIVAPDGTHYDVLGSTGTWTGT